MGPAKQTKEQDLRGVRARGGSRHQAPPPAGAARQAKAPPAAEPGRASGGPSRGQGSVREMITQLNTRRDGSENRNKRLREASGDSQAEADSDAE